MTDKNKLFEISFESYISSLYNQAITVSDHYVRQIFYFASGILIVFLYIFEKLLTEGKLIFYMQTWHKVFVSCGIVMSMLSCFITLISLSYLRKVIESRHTIVDLYLQNKIEDELDSKRRAKYEKRLKLFNEFSIYSLIISGLVLLSSLFIIFCAMSNWIKKDPTFFGPLSISLPIDKKENIAIHQPSFILQNTDKGSNNKSEEKKDVKNNNISNDNDIKK